MECGVAWGKRYGNPVGRLRTSSWEVIREEEKTDKFNSH